MRASTGAIIIASESSAQSVADGQQVFRFETFGDEQYWTDTLHLNQVVEKGMDPTTALKIGLKVDADVLPAGLLQKADLKSTATTCRAAPSSMQSSGCKRTSMTANPHRSTRDPPAALCHSTVDNSVMPGIGHRKDGWPEP